MLGKGSRAPILVAVLLAGCTSTGEQRENLTQGTPTEQVEAVNYFAELEGPPGGPPSQPYVDLMTSVAEGGRSGIARSAAMHAMGERQHPAFLESLLAALEPQAPDPSKRGELAAPRETSYVARLRAVEALGNYRDPRVVAALGRVLTDGHEHTWVRMEAAQSLTLLGDRAAIPALIAGLDEGNPSSVRFDAHLGLKALTGLDLPRKHDDWVEWWEKEGRQTYAPAGPTGP